VRRDWIQSAPSSLDLDRIELVAFGASI